MFSDKKILLGVTGGIAAYKSCEVIRELTKQGAAVRVVMTDAATKFIAPLTFATLSNQPVLSDLFGNHGASATVHIEAARWADAVLICPATANTIGKIASGIADNLLTTLVMASTAPVIVCPAMNKEMYANVLFQQNLTRLEQAGYLLVQPEAGELACGEVGWGRLADTVHIINRLKMVLIGNDQLKGKKVLITAGRTEEPLDPVRFISNRSSGKMGFALAESAALRGARVTLISGPTELMPFDGINYVSVRTADQMAQAVEAELSGQDVVIMAAAVADFKPAVTRDHKLKKSDSAGTIELVRTKDILKHIGQSKGNMLLVGFAVETENEMAFARKKLIEKNLDLVVLNNPLEPGAGFGTDTNIVTLIDAAGKVEKLPLMSKREVADKILDRVVALMKSNRATH